MFCQACGAQIAEHVQFCPNCGTNPFTPRRSTPSGAPTRLQPHRGVAILVLGILGLSVCFICGAIAWVMGNNDLREMECGRMDASGLNLTKAGRICGMIGTILNLVFIGIYVIGVFCAVVLDV